MMEFQHPGKAKQSSPSTASSHRTAPTFTNQGSQPGLTPERILQFQKAYGNRAVTQLLQAKADATSPKQQPIQRRLVIRGDEQEADDTRTDLTEMEMQYLKQTLGASEQATALLRNMAKAGIDYPFSSWRDAVLWANAQVGNGSKDAVSLQSYLEKEDRMEEEDNGSGTTFKNGASFEGKEQVAMPFEMVGDLGERLVLEWVSSWGIQPQAVKNASGHGLDVMFLISAQEILALKPDVQEVFSSMIRGSKQEWLQHVSVNEKFIVAFEVKVNGSQLSKAQKNSDQYMYEKSKKDYGGELRDAIDGGKHPELFYLANVRLSRDEPSKAYFDMSRRDDESNLGVPSNPDRFDLASNVPYSYMNSTEIGDAGEKFARNLLVESGYTSIGSLQNDSGHGVDLVALDPDGRIAYFEVKTHYGAGKAPKLTKREKKQSEFVGEILWKICNGVKPYANAPHEVRQKAVELINEMMGRDQEDRELRGERPIAHEQVNYAEVVRNYLDNQAVYHILDVTFPSLGETGFPEAKVMEWKKSTMNQ